ncbi:MAG: hypothetical protein MR051_02420, partial [Lentisphaeria bacterium]|nr:hypothetical protein [Lentisphaeria bacterium]
MYVEIYSSGALVESGAVINHAVIASGGNDSMYVFDGGVAGNTQVNAGGMMYVFDGGTAAGGAVNSKGKAYIQNGGTISSGAVNEYGTLGVSDGGMAVSTTVAGAMARLEISSGGMAEHTCVTRQGIATVLLGGTARYTSVYTASVSSGLENDPQSGSFRIYGTAEHSVIGQNCTVMIYGSATVAFTSVAAAGIVNGMTLLQSNYYESGVHVSSAVVKGNAY